MNPMLRAARWVVCLTPLLSWAQATEDRRFVFRNSSAFAPPPSADLVQGYSPDASTPTYCGSTRAGWTCTLTSDYFASGTRMEAGDASVTLYPDDEGIVSKGCTVGPLLSLSTSVTVPLSPAPSPGDFELAAVAVSALDGGVEMVSSPKGWSRVAAIQQDGLTLVVDWKVFVTGDLTPMWSWPSTAYSSAAVTVFGGVDPNAPLDGPGVNGPLVWDGGASSSLPFATQLDDDRVVSVFASSSGDIDNLSPANDLCVSSGMNLTPAPSVASGDVFQLLAGDAGIVTANRGMTIGTFGNPNMGATVTLALHSAQVVCPLEVEMLRSGGLVVGTGTIDVSSTSPGSLTGSFATTQVDFLEGERLQMVLWTPANAQQCPLQLAFDSVSTPMALLTPLIHTLDAGSTSDAGALATDAGPSQCGVYHVGCGAGACDSPWMVCFSVLALLAAGSARRRVSSRAHAGWPREHRERGKQPRAKT